MDWLTPNDYAELWHVVPQMVRQYIRDGRVPAEKVDGKWRIQPGLEKPPTHRRYADDFTPEEVAERVKRRKEYDHSYYKRYVEAGKCFVCKTRYAQPGYTQCEICREKARRERKQRQDYNREMCRARYWRLRNDGRCANCGEVVDDGKTLCQRCKAKAAETQQVYHIKKRIDRQIKKEIARLKHGNSNNS